MSTGLIPGWANNLKRLRAVGSGRNSPSSAYAALKGKVSRGHSLLDIGCGESYDRQLATSRGVVAYGVDLFPPTKRTRSGFVRADVRRLPFADKSMDAAICQAVVSLIPPDDRFNFYAEALRVLKPYGYFSLVFCRLVDGWKINTEHESARLVYLGFHHIRAGLYQKGGV